jgi:predicted phage baseplate assembly protein
VPLTPQTIANRPGLDALAYRVGTHSSFLETMKARLSSSGFPKLGGLRTREGSDPSIALLDAWAAVADVLTFYQERLANEGYLRTATERRSVLELARLVGYEPRPGVAASVHLAYLLDPGPETVIPAGARAQSVPGPGELPQPFETSEGLTARADWNDLQVRLTRPQRPEALTDAEGWPVALHFKGIATNLKANDALLIHTDCDPEVEPALYRVLTVTPDPVKDRTQVDVEPWIQEEEDHTFYGDAAPEPDAAVEELSSTDGIPAREIGTVDDVPATTRLADTLGSLGKPPAPQPRNSRRLDRDVRALFGSGSDLAAQLLTVDRRDLRDVLYTAWENVPVTPRPCLRVCALRTHASVFGHNAPRKFVRREDGEGGVVTETQEWTLLEEIDGVLRAFQIAVLSSSGGDFLSGEASAAAGASDASLTTRVTLGATSQSHTSGGNDQFSLSFPTENEVINVDVSVGSEALFLLLTFEFTRRQLTIEVRIASGQWSEAQVTVTSDKALLDEVTSDQSSTNGSIRIHGVVRDPAGSTPTEEPRVVWLDSHYQQILPESWIVLERPISSSGAASSLVVAQVLSISQRSRAEYGMSAKSDRLELDRTWLLNSDDFWVIRGTAVHAQCEELELAEEPIDPVLEDVCGSEIELARLYDGLQPGRWLIFSGERTDVGQLDGQGNVVVPVAGVQAAELAMLAGVAQGVADESGERTHTTLTLAEKLAYCYRRDTLKIYGNVAHATHGESRSEVLGSADGAKALQAFTLKQPPLTYVSAPTPSGIESTLAVRVNDILWHEADSMAGLGPADRSYVTQSDDEARTTVIFGNGERGARPPTGRENVRAVYRSGIGPGGNVKSGQISQLATRPLGVKEVINPLPATGGAGPESRDQARRNAPLAVMALDRLVSVQDYEDFSRTFAGVGKASAKRLSDGRVELIHVTIAGEGDIPIAVGSDLLLNLEAALRLFGDPRQALRLEIRQRSFLVVQAGVRLLADYLWEAVEPKIRAAMLAAFGFDRRDLGQGALLSEVYRTIQEVRGVDLVDVDVFAAIDPAALPAALSGGGPPLVAAGTEPRLPADLARIDGSGAIQPAQLLCLTPEVRDTLILKERTS